MTNTIKHVSTVKGTLRLIRNRTGYSLLLETKHIKSVSVFADYEKANRDFNQLLDFI